MRTGEDARLSTSLLWTVGAFVAVGARGLGLYGGNLIGDATDREWAVVGAVASQFLHDVVVVARTVVLCEAGKGLGQNLVVVYVLQNRLPGYFNPQPLKSSPA